MDNWYIPKYNGLDLFTYPVFGKTLHWSQAGLSLRARGNNLPSYMVFEQMLQKNNVSCKSFFPDLNNEKHIQISFNC